LRRCTIIQDVKIVVVENDPELLHLMLNTLRYCVNREVNGFGNIPQARQYFKEGGKADILILNVGFPDANGFDFMAQVKQQHAQMTCIAVSGVKVHAEIAGEKGADGFLGKPFEINDLFDIVQCCVVEASREKQAI